MVLKMGGNEAKSGVENGSSMSGVGQPIYA